MCNFRGSRATYRGAAAPAVHGAPDASRLLVEQTTVADDQTLVTESLVPTRLESTSIISLPANNNRAISFKALSQDSHAPTLEARLEAEPAAKTADLPRPEGSSRCWSASRWVVVECCSNHRDIGVLVGSHGVKLPRFLCWRL